MKTVHASNLVLALYGLMLNSLDYENSRSLRKVIVTPEVEAWFSITPGLKMAVRQYIQGVDVELTDLGKGLRVLSEKLARSPDIANVYIEMVKAFGLYFRTSSEGAYTKLARLSATMKQPWLSAFFTKEVRSQKPIIEALRAIVKRVTRRNEYALTPEETNKLKENNQDLWKEYNRLRREFNQIWKDAMSTFVRQSGKNLVPIQDVEKFLAKKGLESTYPKGFTGLVDADGRWYTSDGKLIAGVPAGNIFSAVRMNPKYKSGSGEGVFQTIRKDGNPGGYFYTIDHIQRVTKEKFEHVRDLTSNIDKLRRKWIPLIKQFDESKPNTVAAVILELLFTFSARVGSVGNAFQGQSTFGMATLQVKHYYPQTDGGFILRYLGKKGVKTVHRMRPTDPLNRFICGILKQLADGKKSNEPLFTYMQANGFRKLVQPGRVNLLFRQLGAGDVGVHKLRTYAATKIFRELMNDLFAKKPSFTDVKQANAAFLKIAEAAGKTLNHVRKTAEGGTTFTAATVLRSYIDISAQLEFFKFYKLALPKYLEILVGNPDIQAKALDSSNDGTDSENEVDEDIEGDIELETDDVSDLDVPEVTPYDVDPEDVFNDYGLSSLDPEWNPSMYHPDNLLIGTVK